MSLPSEEQRVPVTQRNSASEGTGAGVATPTAGPAMPQASSIVWGDSGNEKIKAIEVICVLLACMIPNAAIVLALSDIGEGIKIYDMVATPTLSMSGDAAVTGAAFIMALFYVTDWFYWKSSVLQVVTAVIPVLMITCGAILKARRYPWAPILFTLFLIPVFLGILRSTKCNMTKRRHFYNTIAVGTGICAVAITAIWVAWMMNGHEWNRETKDGLAARCPTVYKYMKNNTFALDFYSDCHPTLANLANYSTADQKGIKEACAQASSIWFLVWMSPFIAAVSNMVVAIFCFMHGVALKHAKESAAIVRALKQFIICLIFLFAGMYGSVSFTSLALSSTFMAFFGAAMTTLVVWTFLEIGSEALIHLAEESKFAKLLASAWRHDVTRAIAVGASNVFIPVYLCLNMLNQKLRRCRGVAENDGRFTTQAAWLLKEIETWNWASILTKVAIIAEGIFTLQVGISKVTYIFLSWLTGELVSWHFGVVCFLVFAIGNFMFMLPPVPGVPVYVFTGIVIADQGDRKLGGNGFIYGILIAAALALANKLTACCGQYAIGYFLGKKVKVQQLIHVDSVPTRAIESIVKRRGINIGKVAILIGGPDWPTSVGCGMVKVNIPQMLLGTLPVFFLLSPCVVAGAFIARQGSGGEDSIFPMLANLSLVAATVTQTGSMLTAGMIILKEIQEKGDELSAYRPEHDAVAELTRKEAHANRLYAQVSKWSNLSTLDRVVLLGMTGLCEFSVFMMVMMSSACFLPFQLDKSVGIATDISEGGLSGNPLNIVKPLGSIALLLFAAGVLLHIVHSQMMKSKLKAALKANPAPLKDEEADPSQIKIEDKKTVPVGDPDAPQFAVEQERAV